LYSKYLNLHIVAITDLADMDAKVLTNGNI